MSDDILRLHVARSYTSSDDSPFSLISQEDGSMPCDKPANVLYFLFYCAKLHPHYIIVNAIGKWSFFFSFTLSYHLPTSFIHQKIA